MWRAVVDEDRRSRCGESSSHDLQEQQSYKSCPDRRASLLAGGWCCGWDEREEGYQCIDDWKAVEEDPPTVNSAETGIDYGVEE